MKPGIAIPLIIDDGMPIDRRRHHKINANPLLLDPAVSRVYFDRIVSQLVTDRGADAYSHVWKVKDVFYPNVFIEVLISLGRPSFIISFNFRNYNYSPPQVGLLTLDLQLIQQVNKDAILPDKDGTIHVINNPEGAWFCTPGTWEYHEFYFDLDRWEKERYGNTCNIIELINRIIAMIDRSKEINGAPHQHA